MLAKILSLFGHDLAASIDTGTASFERWLRRAADHINGLARQTLVIAILGFAALVTSMMAAAAGLIAIYRMTADVYGDYAGLGVVAGILSAATIVLVALIVARTRRLGASPPASTTSNVSVATAASEAAVRGSAAADPDYSPALVRSPASADDLIAPLAAVLSDVVTFPTLGNPAVDRMIDRVRLTARGSADEAVRCAADVIRSGRRLDLMIVLAGTAAIAWLVTSNARSRA